MRVLVAGATGFIGQSLLPLLIDREHDVFAMTRSSNYAGIGTAVIADTGDPQSLDMAMTDMAAAYYLVHGLDGGDFVERDAQAARNFGRAAADQGLSQIIYLGGLGREGDDLSDHLASRQEVAGELGRHGVPVTTIRAALVIGAGSASFELLRQMVQRLPLLTLPPGGASTLVQPIDVRDVLRYLVGVLDLPAAINRTFDVGGPDVTTYGELLATMARLMGARRMRLPGVPMPGWLVKGGVRLMTDVDPQLAASLLDSIGNDVVAEDRRLIELLPGPLVGLQAMLQTSLAAEDSGA